MKKNLPLFGLMLFFISLAACSGSGKETASSIAKKWCDLNGKVYRSEGEAKEQAKATRKKFEENIDFKYKNDEAFLKEVKKEVEKCEGTSEGR